MKTKTEKLDEEIANFEALLKEKQQEKKILTEDPEKELATNLHDMFCPFNHADQCNWLYDKGNWSMSSRKAYLTRARQFKRKCDTLQLDTEDTLELIKFTRSF